MSVPSQSSGSSSCEFGCFDIFQPVCASNGQTFGNECEFNRTRCSLGDDTLTIVSQGPCVSPNGSSSGSKSSCLQNLVCLDVYTPVCGSDGRTYRNECFLSRAHCSNSTLTILRDRECDASPSEGCSGEGMQFTSSTSDDGICTERVCTKEFQPLCGSDEVTYGNKCLFQNAKCCNSTLTLAFEGECSDKSGSTSGPAQASESALWVSDAIAFSRKSSALLSIVTVLAAILALCA